MKCAEQQRAQRAEHSARVRPERREGAPPAARGGGCQLYAQHAADRGGQLHRAPELLEQRADGRLLVPRRRRDARAPALDRRQPLRLPRLLQQVLVLVLVRVLFTSTSSVRVAVRVC